MAKGLEWTTKVQVVFIIWSWLTLSCVVGFKWHFISVESIHRSFYIKEKIYLWNFFPSNLKKLNTINPINVVSLGYFKIIWKLDKHHLHDIVMGHDFLILLFVKRWFVEVNLEFKSVTYSCLNCFVI